MLECGPVAGEQQRGIVLLLLLPPPVVVVAVVVVVVVVVVIVVAVGAAVVSVEVLSPTWRPATNGARATNHVTPSLSNGKNEGFEPETAAVLSPVGRSTTRNEKQRNSAGKSRLILR